MVAGLTIFEPGESSSLHNHPESEEIQLHRPQERKVLSDGEEENFGSNSFMFIPKGIFHRHVNTGDEPLWLTFTYTPPGETPKDLSRIRIRGREKNVKAKDPSRRLPVGRVAADPQARRRHRDELGSRGDGGSADPRVSLWDRSPDRARTSATGCGTARSWRSMGPMPLVASAAVRSTWSSTTTGGQPTVATDLTQRAGRSAGRPRSSMAPTSARSRWR